MTSADKWKSYVEWVNDVSSNAVKNRVKLALKGESAASIATKFGGSLLILARSGLALPHIFLLTKTKDSTGNSSPAQVCEIFAHTARILEKQNFNEHQWSFYPPACMAAQKWVILAQHTLYSNARKRYFTLSLVIYAFFLQQSLNRIKYIGIRRMSFRNAWFLFMFISKLLQIYTLYITRISENLSETSQRVSVFIDAFLARLVQKFLRETQQLYITFVAENPTVLRYLPRIPLTNQDFEIPSAPIIWEYAVLFGLDVIILAEIYYFRRKKSRATILGWLPQSLKFQQPSEDSEENHEQSTFDPDEESEDLRNKIIDDIQKNEDVLISPAAFASRQPASDLELSAPEKIPKI